MMNIHAYSGVLSAHAPIFLQQNIALTGRPPLYKVTPTDAAQRPFLTPVININNYCGFYFF